MKNYDFHIRKIYLLKNQKNTHTAIERIFNKRTQQLRGVFNYDKNHSWYILGDLLIHLNLLNDAITAFKRALSAYPDDWQALFAIGKCYSDLEKNSFARKYFNRALKIKNNNPNILYNIGNSYFDQGNYTEAKEFCLSAIKFDDEGKIYELASKNLEKARVLIKEEHE